MKKHIIISLFVLFVTSAVAQAQKFGDDLSDAKALKTTTLSQTMAGKETMQVKLEGEIKEVCQMKGCWMTVDAGNDMEIRVTLSLKVRLNMKPLMSKPSGIMPKMPANQKKK